MPIPDRSPSRRLRSGSPHTRAVRHSGTGKAASPPRQAHRALALTLLVLAGALPASGQVPTARPPAPQGTGAIITFEEFTTAGPGQGGQVRVATQYPGVRFNSPWILDYSKGLAIPGFAHSGTRAVVLCYGVEFCGDTLFQVRFQQPQARIRVWVGTSSARGEGVASLRAYDAGGVLVGRAAAQFGATNPPRIQTPLEVTLTTNRISVFTVAAQGVRAPDFAMDDVEYHQASPAPPARQVPDLRGMSLDDARRALEARDMFLGRVDSAVASPAPGTVLRQRPDPGAPVAPGQRVTVDVIVARREVVAVPNLLNRSFDEARALLSNARLSPGEVTRVSAPSVAGTVTGQRPEPGTLVPPGSSVAVEVSTGPPGVPVPNVVGRSEAGAVALLSNAGLTLGPITRVAGSATAGTVTRQRPEPGTLVPPGSRVAIQVSSGPAPPPRVRVPYLVGRTLDEARSILSERGLALGRVDMTRAQAPPGAIESQTPDSGTPVTAGDSVSLVVSLGPPPVTVPSSIPPWVIWTGAGAITLAIGGAVRRWRRPRQSPTPRLNARLASAGLDRQEATMTEQVPLDFELRLTMRSDSLTAEYEPDRETGRPEAT